jgi:hypothetical protein
MAFSGWIPGEPFRRGHGDVPLVRPYARSRHPEPAPDSARPVELARVCDRCPAEPLVVFWRAVVDETGTAAVRELQLCGNHANAYESLIDEQGWVVVLDRRQSSADGWRMH